MLFCNLRNCKFVFPECRTHGATHADSADHPAFSERHSCSWLSTVDKLAVLDCQRLQCLEGAPPYLWQESSPPPCLSHSFTFSMHSPCTAQVQTQGETKVTLPIVHHQKLLLDEFCETNRKRCPKEQRHHWSLFFFH